MVMINQFRVEVFGAAVSVLSAVVANFWAQSVERKRQRTDQELSAAEGKIASCNHQFENSERTGQFAELLLALVQGTSLPLPRVESNIEKVIHLFLKSILARHSAVTGDRPSDEEWKQWTEIGTRAKREDEAAWNELSSISQGLIDEYATEHNRRVADRDRLRSEKSKLETSEARIRYFGAAIQILGIVVILLKGLAPK